MSYSYDGLGRTSSQYIYTDSNVAISNPLTRSYSYLAGANGGTTGLVSGVTYSGTSTSAYTYSYDARGNITEVRKNGSLVASYAYDDLNQLVRENNVTANKTWVYTYDERGNILSRKTYAYTTGTLGTVQDTDTYQYFEQTSEYLWGDGLLRYDSTEYNFYDAIGNPLTYNNGSAYTFAWSNGRQLTSGTKGTTSFAYTYNADGLRTQKVVDGVVTDYYWAGSQLAMMVITNGTSIKTLKFYYDAEGRPMCLDYNGTIYFYITNLQGDVVALADQYGEVIRYEYDAWGKPIISEYYFSSHSEVMQNNPLRYRGYIYDSETGFYYLQSRYYDPVVGRFINSDGYVSTGQGFIGYNMFAYCGNNPVNREDSTGRFWITALIVTAVVAVCTVTLSGCSSQSAPSSPRSDLANAPDLDVSTASPGSYNCYGNGIGKQICADHTGYIRGDSTRETFEAVKNDLGSNNVRELTSISDPIGDDEFKVALKCGPMDYHFIRLDSNGWYNKSGNAPGLYIDQSVVAEDIWYAMWMNNGQAYVGNPKYGFPFYNDETIYFAVKVEWDVQ